MLQKNEKNFDKEQQQFLSHQYQQQLKDKQMQNKFELDNKKNEQAKIRDEASYAKSVCFDPFKPPPYRVLTLFYRSRT
jgi:hypothetical protein